MVVVVSARARQTDSFLADARTLASHPPPRELDMLLTSGERISAALFSIALNALGIPTVSLTGSQAGIITDDNHTNARIIEIRPVRVVRALQENFVAVVGGFQGVSFKKEITTLGRGGSDISAVALASALEAQRCEIFSDVDGVFTADPNQVAGARRLDTLSYQEMQELAEAGARVLHPASLEFAKLKNTLVHARCTMDPEGAGTIIQHLEDRMKPAVVGIASEARVTLLHFRQMPQEAKEILPDILDFCRLRGLRSGPLSSHLDEAGQLTGSLIIPEKENYHLESLLEQILLEFPSQVRIRRELSSVSMVGARAAQHSEYLGEALDLLSLHQIQTVSVHSSSFRINLLVDRRSEEEAVRLLHRRFIEQSEAMTQ